MRKCVYLILLCLMLPSSYAQEDSAEFSILASQYIQGKLSSVQIEKQIKNRLPTAIPIFIQTIDGSAETSTRKKELLLDLSKAIRNRSAARERLIMPVSIAAFALLEAAVVWSGYYDMSNDPFYVRHPDLMREWIELRAMSFAPALSAISIPFGLIPLRGQAARNKAISELDACSLFLTNETLLNEAI